MKGKVEYTIMKKTFTYLIAIAALMIISASAMAQGGANPFVGSSHGYKIVPGDAGNTMAWSVAQGVLNADYEINYSNGDTINIKWLTAGIDTLIFSETDAVTGCLTVRELEIIVQPNTFDVSTSDPAATCNSKDGTINPSGDATTAITFTVNMTTGIADWNPDWEIEFQLLSSGSKLIADVAASQGDLTKTGFYRLTNLSSSGGNGTVDITMNVTEDVFTLLEIDLVINSAIELDYSLSDIDTDDWTATQTINALPNTSPITTD